MADDRENSGLRKRIPPRDAYAIIFGLLVGSVLVLIAMWVETHYQVSWALPVVAVLCLPVGFVVRRAMGRIDGREG